MRGENIVATTINKRGRAYRLRSYIAALTISSGLTAGVSVPAQAQDASSVLKQLSDAMGKGGDIAGLAGAIADAQGEVQRLEGQIGEHREAVNRALVDLQDARTQLRQANQGADSASAELKAAEKAVQDAQRKLDELSRTAYRRANTSEAITGAAGADERQTMLERRAYLRTQADEQRAVVEQLERKRVEKANHGSTMRKAQRLAQVRADRATDAEALARAVLEESSNAIMAALQQRDELVSQEAAAQDALNRARGVDAAPAVNASASSGNVQSTSATVDGETSAQATTTADATSAAAPASATAEPANVTASTAASEAITETAADNAAEAVAETAPAAQSGADTAASASGAEGAQTAAQAAAQAVPATDQQAALAQGSSLGAEAAAVVAQFQPVHTEFAGSSQSDLVAIQNLLVAAADVINNGATAGAQTQSGDAQLATVAPSDEENQLANELGVLLESLPTVETVTEQATQVAGQGTDSRIETVIARAQSQVGVPYAWGGGDANGPTKGIRDGGVADSYGDYNKIGFDCSGLVLYAFAGAGISLPHYTGYQYNHGTKVDPSQMQRGDLIFYGPSGNWHVAIYLGDGMMIEAPQSGGVVQVTPVRQSGMSPYAVRLI